MHFHAQRSLYNWRDGVDITAWKREGDKVAVAKPIEYLLLEPMTAAAAPSFQLDMTAAQLLMDELWQCGLRPTEGAGSAGALAATTRHLEDMRKLVFEVMSKPPLYIGDIHSKK